MTLIVLTRGVMSTPSSSGVSTSIGFFFALMMLGSDANRGSLSLRSVVTTAGILSLMVSRPPSISRVRSISPSLISILYAKVPWGQPSTAASIWPVCVLSPSIDCLPVMTSPGCSRSTTAFINFAMASGSISASVRMRIPRSAPIARAVRMVS